WLVDREPAAPSPLGRSSPYTRAERSASIALEAADLVLPSVLDERLREREFGVLDRLTNAGILQQYPEQAEARSRIGKFYHRPPEARNWCDVALRIRSVLDSVTREHSGERVMIVAHLVVILMLRYLIEQLRETDILTISREVDLANCSGRPCGCADRSRGARRGRVASHFVDGALSWNRGRGRCRTRPRHRAAGSGTAHGTAVHVAVARIVSHVHAYA